MLAGMIYVMPGMQSTLHAVLNRPGNYEGLSANYSGAGFSDMRFQLKGVDQAGFDAWVAQAKASGRALDLAAYEQLVKPSEKVPAMQFAAVDSDLYRRILERCVEPGTPCMTDLMEHDRMRGGGNPHDVRPGAGMPQRGNSMPMHGAKPDGAMLRSPEEKGEMVNTNRFKAPEDHHKAPAQPPEDRKISAATPASVVAAA
jgi:cytochrome o ubiquinol oxidase subunit 2